MPRKPTREKKLIGGRYQFPPSANQPSFHHPLGEPTDAVVAFLKRKEEVHEKAPTYPVLEKPRDGVIGRYKCVPRMVHVPVSRTRLVSYLLGASVRDDLTC